ncbi:MAG TPA: LLM class flavin-dependent oxidoreductase [Candidatus Limnocylindrales bacterium]
MKLGLAIGGSPRDVAEQARLAEAAGLESVWVTELEHSAFVQAAAAIAATSTIRVGTGVALAFPRSPTITAMEAADLDGLSGGRFLLGLGSQVRRVLEARFSVPYASPAARLAEYAAAVRTVWAARRGEPARHEGTFYRVDMPTFHGEPDPTLRDVPMLFAAVGTAMARAAGRTADGVLGHPVASPRYLGEVVEPAVASGLADAARTPDGCPISATAIVSIDPDRELARRRAKLQVAFYATTPNYRAILELHHRPDLGRALRRAFVRRDHGAMADLVDDDLLDAIAIAGRPDELADRLDGWETVPTLERVVLAPPWYGVPEASAGEAVRTIIAAVGRRGRAGVDGDESG